MSRTVIVFQEDCILAAAGREGKYPGITRAERIRLQGQGDSFERWQQALRGLSAEWKTEPVHLVLPANLCSARVLKLPYGRGRQLADMASREVADSFRNEMADYSVVFSDKNGGVEICAGGAGEEQLDRFEEICGAAGLTVGGMTVPMEGYIRVLRQLDSYRNDTAVYLFFDEGSMTSVLCQNGHYLYSGRSRLFSEPGTLDFGTEIVRSLSGILQFYTSEKRDIPITDVYYAGCPDGDFEVSAEGIEALHLRAKPLEPDCRIDMPVGERAADWIPCIGAMLYGGRGEKQINLYRERKRNAGKAEKAAGIWRHFALPAVVLAICLIPVIVVAVWNLRVCGEIKKKQEWIADPGIQEQYGQALALGRQLSAIAAGIREVWLTTENLSVYPEITTDVLHGMEHVGGDGISCKVTGYDASTGVLTFRASSREVIDVPVYILKLQSSGLFHTVDYTGYDFENDWYTLELSCTMEGKNAREVDGK